MSKEHPNPLYRQELMKGRFSFSEEERVRMKDQGMTDEEIKNKEEKANARLQTEKEEHGESPFRKAAEIIEEEKRNK